MSRVSGLLLLGALISLSLIYHNKLAVEANNAPAVVQVPRRLEPHILNTDGFSRTIRIQGNSFMLDEKPLQIISGSAHYFRMPAEYWRDRLRKLKAAGLNAVSTYVEWSFHEPEERQYRFEGDHDVARFVRTAAEEGLLVLLRPGPYICAERDLGGLPYWLLSKYPSIRLRTSDSDFIKETRTWFAKLFEFLTPLLYENGGPIILVQVENEYGSYGSDMAYKVLVRDIIQGHVSNKSLLYTTDGTFMSMIRGGYVPGALTTIDFGTTDNVLSMFDNLKVISRGPLMNSEFYPGWLTHWGEALQQVPTNKVIDTLKQMMDNKINVNIYVFFGGTNFEFSAGANDISNMYKPDITSYDYDAPLNEAGDPTPKYYAIRELLQTYNLSLKTVSLPMPAPKGNYGKLTMVPKINLLSNDGRLHLGKRYASVTGTRLPTFEGLRQRAGLLLYETTLYHSQGTLEIRGPRDRIYVYLSGELQGIIDRMSNTFTVHFRENPSASKVLSLLVENNGRINYGHKLHDFKGILGDVKFNNSVLNGTWSVTGYPLEKVVLEPPFPPQPTTTSGPVMYEADLTIQKALDTFIDTTGWGKGYVWMNERNLGRYWPGRGPQATLYVPGVWLRAAPAHNTVRLLELERPPEHPTIDFIDHPILNRSSPDSLLEKPKDLIFDDLVILESKDNIP